MIDYILAMLLIHVCRDFNIVEERMIDYILAMLLIPLHLLMQYINRLWVIHCQVLGGMGRSQLDPTVFNTDHVCTWSVSVCSYSGTYNAVHEHVWHLELHFSPQDAEYCVKLSC